MTREEKQALSIEMLTNMDLTKEQYIEMCGLCDDLDLQPKGDEPADPEDMSWEEIVGE